MKQFQEISRSFNLSDYFTLANLIIGALLSICIILPGIVLAQQKQTFYSFSYYKILPGKEQEFRNMMQAVDSRVHQDRVNKGAISSWYLYEVLSPTGSSAEYDYVMITTTHSLKNIFESPYSFDSAFKKSFPGKGTNFFTNYHSTQSGVRKLVKEEVYVGLAFADSSFPDGFKLKYIITDFMQPRPGMGARYVKTEIDTFRIIHRERIKLGAISQWAFIQLIAPYDEKIGYNYLALNFYDNIDKIFDFSASKYEEGLKNSFPNVSLTSLFQSVSATRNNPRAETLRLLLYSLPKQ